jgi:oxygen-independent coproporphyrinogen-3 oxidase
MKHLYVHIPFCRSRCTYCDFSSEPIGPHLESGHVEQYVEALLEELAERTGFDTIYLGGGTPTVLPAELLLPLVDDLAARLMPTAGGSRQPTSRQAAVRQLQTGCEDSMQTDHAPEFTVEANPGTIDAALLERLHEAGVTRLSLGIQSFSPRLRYALGRQVGQTEIFDALSALRAVGWREWNLDLVFGIPGQTWQTASEDIDSAVAAGPTHISLYDLTYTPALRARLETDAPEKYVEFTETYFGEAVARLEAAGYRRYEVSNFALPGHECRHNQAYWRGEDYLGVGVSAVSTIGCERRANPRSVAGYLAGDAPEIETLTPRIRLWEKAMLGLRTSGGVDEEEVSAVLDRVALERLLGQGCIETRCGKLRLNRGFLDVSNAVISALLVRPGESQTLESS